MVNYKCPRCGYEINIKTKYINHLRRKKLCDNKISNNNLNDEYIKYEISDKIKKNNLTPKCPKMTHITKIMTPKCPKMTPNDPNNQCKYCDKFLFQKMSFNKTFKNLQRKEER